MKKRGLLLFFLFLLQQAWAQREPAPFAVIGFTLMNADTEIEIVQLRSGDVINLALLPSRQLNLRANFRPNTLPLAIGSVVFAFNDSLHTENYPPYAWWGDLEGDYLGWTPEPGSYTVTATPYSGANGTGSEGESATLHFTVIDQPLQLPSAVYRLNAGGTDYIDPQGVIFNSDNYVFLSQATYFAPDLPHVQGTDAGGLYLSERISNEDLGQFYYYLPVSPGNYTVKLHFAEIYFGVPGGDTTGDPVGRRVFDVNIDGEHNLVNFDIAREAGVATALIKTFEVSTNDGNITLGFTGKVNRPKIAAIEILRSTAPNRPPLANANANGRGSKVITLNLPDNRATVVGTWSDEDGYVTGVQWNQVSGPAARFSGETTSNLQLHDLVAGTYVFRLTVTDNSGASASDEVTVQVLPEENLQAGVYPNPTSGEFTITLAAIPQAPVHLQVYDRYGKLYYEKSEAGPGEQYRVNALGFPPGLYFLRIESGGSTRTLQVFKQ